MALPTHLASRGGGFPDSSTLYSSILPRNTSTGKVASQAGVIDGNDPTVYDPKNPLVLFIIQAGIIIIFCRLLEWPLSKIRQPRVIAEVIGGILLGPSVMGRIPGFTQTIFPPASIPNLSLVANLGLVLFLFLIGVEVDLRFLAVHWKATLNVSIGSLLVPFGLGSALAWGVYKEFGQEPDVKHVSFPIFMLFIGLAISITAFPVLCRILTELELLSTMVGNIVLAAGVANDVIGWILLALCVTLVNAGGGLTALWVLLATVGWTLVLFFGVKPLFVRYLHYTGSFHNGPTQGVIVLTLLLVLTSSFFTAIIGVHAIFGAFLVGLICPHESGFAIKLTEKIEDLVSAIFLPLYFTLSGLSTNIGLLDNGITWAYVVAVVFVAFFSKLMGGTLGAKVSGMVWRESLTVGTLMSCKGLVELIVLNIGLQAKILSTRTFTIFVIMALLTTFATTPMVTWLYPQWYQQKLESWRRGEIDLDGNPIPRIPPPGAAYAGAFEYSMIRKVLVFLRADNMVPLLSIVALLRTPPALKPEVHPSLRKDNKEGEENCQPTTAPPSKRLSVHGLSIHGLTDRGSSVMRVSEASELETHDSVLNSFKTGSLLLSNLGVSGEVFTASSYDETVLSRASDLSSDLILLPWAKAGTLTECSTFNYGPFTDSLKAFRSRLSNAEYREFVNSVFFRAPCTTAVLIHRPPFNTPPANAQSPSSGLRPTLHGRTKSFMSARSLSDFTNTITSGFANALNLHISVPFIGGRDDRAALQLGLQIAKLNPGVTLSVLIFRWHSSSLTLAHSHNRKLSREADQTAMDHEGIERAASTDGTAVPHDEDMDEIHFTTFQASLTEDESRRIIFSESVISATEFSRREIMQAVRDDIDSVISSPSNPSSLSTSCPSRECLILPGRSLFRNAIFSKSQRPQRDKVKSNGPTSKIAGASDGESDTIAPSPDQGISAGFVPTAPADPFEQAVPSCLGTLAADFLDNDGLKANVLVVQAAAVGRHAGAGVDAGGAAGLGSHPEADIESVPKQREGWKSSETEV